MSQQNSPQVEFIYHQQSKIIPSGVYFFHRQKFNPRHDSLSPATVIHPQPRLFLQINRSSDKVSLTHRVILSPVYFPAELFSHQFILKSSSVVIPSENGELNSLYSTAAVRDLFSPVREYHKNIACPYIMTYA